MSTRAPLYLARPWRILSCMGILEVAGGALVVPLLALALTGCGSGSKLDVTAACQQWDDIRPGIGGGSPVEFPDRLADLAKNTANPRLAYLFNESWRTTERGDESSEGFAMQMVDNYCQRRS